MNQIFPLPPARRLINWNSSLTKNKEIHPILRKRENRRLASLFSNLHLKILEIQAACFLVSALSHDILLWHTFPVQPSHLTRSTQGLAPTALPPPPPSSAIWAGISSSRTKYPSLLLASSRSSSSLVASSPARQEARVTQDSCCSHLSHGLPGAQLSTFEVQGRKNSGKECDRLNFDVKY